MRPLLFLLLSLCLISSSFAAYHDSAVERQGEHTIISWYTDEPTYSLVWYGVNSLEQYKIDMTYTNYHFIKIKKLNPNKDYIFQIGGATQDGIVPEYWDGNIMFRYEVTNAK
jgi:hypothetical protein